MMARSITLWRSRLVAAEMVRSFNGVITRLTPEQADYINVKVEGPYKPKDYKF
jgi:adenosylhomocysteinase